MKKLFLLIAILFLLASSVSAATVSGSIYNADLTKLKDVVLEVNSVPKQVYVSKDGTYAFNLPVGKYAITASDKSGDYEEENVTIPQEGLYTLDLILIPKLDVIEEDSINVSDLSLVDEITKQKTNTWYLVSFLALIILAYFAIKNLRKSKVMAEATKPVESDAAKEDLSELIAVIKKLGGRTTQKDLRKELPYSEAKISLMLTELEHKKRIERIKKGRGNVIILK